MIICGQRGIRTLGTGKTPYAGLANRCLQPLGHLSMCCSGAHVEETRLRLPNRLWCGTTSRRRPAHDHLRDTIRLSRCGFRGGGGIRTPGACARRFSRPLPSTARPLLQADPEAGGIYRDQTCDVKPDLCFSPDSEHLRSPPGIERSSRTTPQSRGPTSPGRCAPCRRRSGGVRTERRPCRLLAGTARGWRRPRGRSRCPSH